MPHPASLAVNNSWEERQGSSHSRVLPPMEAGVTVAFSGAAYHAQPARLDLITHLSSFMSCQSSIQARLQTSMQGPDFLVSNVFLLSFASRHKISCSFFTWLSHRCIGESSRSGPPGEAFSYYSFPAPQVRVRTPFSFSCNLQPKLQVLGMPHFNLYAFCDFNTTLTA